LGPTSTNRARAAAPPQLSHRLNQPTEVFTRFDGADKKNKFLRQIVAQAQLLALNRIVQRPKIVRRGFVDDVNFCGGQLQDADQILAGVVGNGDNGRCPPGHVRQQQAQRQQAAGGVGVAV
jgi:hypothetical protein